MTVPATDFNPTDTLESVLREDLAQGDAFLGSAAPLLRHFLANEHDSMFSDDIISRIRGMIADLVNQMLNAIAAAANSPHYPEHPAEVVEAFTMGIINQPALLTHIHALAFEWQLTERLEQRLSLDPVVSPLVQALISSPEPNVGGLAMKLLAAQARHGQAQRRMKLPVTELPGDLFHTLLQVMRTVAVGTGRDYEQVEAAEQQVRAGYNEATGRLALISQAVMGMGPGAFAALSVTHAGVATFLTALAMASGQDRDVTTFTTNDKQAARLALSLSAAGLKITQVEEQMLAIHPDLTLPEGYDRLDADRAAAILVSGSLGGQ